MARPRKYLLPRHLELNSKNLTFYYKIPGMKRKENLGKNRDTAVHLAKTLNARYRIQLEQEAARLEASIEFGDIIFEDAFSSFVDKYIHDYRLKSSTSVLLKQRRDRLNSHLGTFQVSMVNTQILREAISESSEFEQSKLKTLVNKFFRYAKSTGSYPPHLPNPVDDLYIDPVPPKRRQRITLAQFLAIYAIAPDWLPWCMTLAFHLALRRVDLVNLRFDDLTGDRIVSPIRKTDSKAREMEATSVDFPIHQDVRRVISAARLSSLKNGRCPFIIHRAPERRTKRAKDALKSGSLKHPAQVLPQFASKEFNKVRSIAAGDTGLFEGMDSREMPTLHEIRALSSHLYENAGYEINAVQNLMAHTDPDMTRNYQKGHARKVLRVDMLLPFSVEDENSEVREPGVAYFIPQQMDQKSDLNMRRENGIELSVLSREKLSEIVF